MKICSKCKETKTLEEYHKDKNKKDGRASYCKICANAASKAHRKTEEGKEAHRRRNRERDKRPEVILKRRAKRYNLLPEELEEIQKYNDGYCYICSDRKATDVDHCHMSGLVRGMLCGRCNKALGLFDDNPEVMMRAAQYIYTAESREAFKKKVGIGFTLTNLGKDKIMSLLPKEQ